MIKCVKCENNGTEKCPLFQKWWVYRSWCGKFEKIAEIEDVGCYYDEKNRLTQAHSNEQLNAFVIKGLTEENITKYSGRELIVNVANKLGHLENIEQVLGVDLITLYKAMKDGFYSINGKHFVNDKNTQIIFGTIGYDSEIAVIVSKNNYQHKFSIRDYGKTWVLSKKELKNDNNI